MSFDIAFPSAMTQVMPVNYGLQSGNSAFRCELGGVGIIFHVFLWFVLFFVTFGVALFLFPYYINKLLINNTYLLSDAGQKIGKLHCNVNIYSLFGNIALWMLISIVTFGVGYVFYVCKVNAYCLGKTSITRDLV